MTNNETKMTRVTKAQRFDDIIAIITGEPVQYETTVQIAVDFLNYEKELLARKNKGENKKQTALQAQNEVYKEEIVEYLASSNVSEEGLTCTELIKSIHSLNDFNTSKVSRLANDLVKAGRLVKKEVKGKSRFSLA